MANSGISMVYKQVKPGTERKKKRKKGKRKKEKKKNQSSLIPFHILPVINRWTRCFTANPTLSVDHNSDPFALLDRPGNLSVVVIRHIPNGRLVQASMGEDAQDHGG